MIATLPRASEQVDWDRFEALYRSTRNDLYAYVVTLLRDATTAEDVTALAFERAFRRRRSFNRKRGNERAWLFGIARNAALDELRRQRRAAALDVEELADDEPTAYQDDSDVQLRRTAVRVALHRLPAREREVIALKFFAGLSNRELAEVLGVSESNDGTILHRTIEKLRTACNATV